MRGLIAGLLGAVAAVLVANRCAPRFYSSTRRVMFVLTMIVVTGIALGAVFTPLVRITRGASALAWRYRFYASCLPAAALIIPLIMLTALWPLSYTTATAVTLNWNNTFSGMHHHSGLDLDEGVVIAWEEKWQITSSLISYNEWGCDFRTFPSSSSVIPKGTGWFAQLGFGHERLTYPGPIPAITKTTFPCFVPLLCLGPVAFFLGRASIRRIQRVSRALAGRCTTCGYDLRASVARCPECGTIPANRRVDGATALNSRPEGEVRR